MYIFTLAHMNALIATHANVFTHKYGDTFATHIVASLYTLSSHIIFKLYPRTLSWKWRRHTHTHTHTYKDL